MPMVAAPDYSLDESRQDQQLPIVQAPSDYNIAASNFEDEWNVGNKPNALGPGATDRIQRRNQDNINGGNMQNVGNFDYELAYFSNQAQNNKNKSAIKDMN